MVLLVGMRMMDVFLMKTNNHLKDNGYSLDEEEEVFNDCLKRVFDNPRFYLDNLLDLREFRVSWIDYRGKICHKRPLKSKGL